MSTRLDVVRSWVRAAADHALQRMKDTRVASIGAQIMERLTQQRWRLSDEALTAAAAHAEGVESAMVRCHSGRLFVDASMRNGREVQFSLTPRGVRFAPRGAKEITFDVEPPDGHDSSIVGALAACIARATWPMIAPDAVDIGAAIVDREGPERVRVDLRTVPAVRDFVATQAGAMLFDFLELESVRVEPGALALKLKMPQLGP